MHSCISDASSIFFINFSPLFLPSSTSPVFVPLTRALQAVQEEEEERLRRAGISKAVAHSPLYPLMDSLLKFRNSVRRPRRPERPRGPQTSCAAWVESVCSLRDRHIAAMLLSCGHTNTSAGLPRPFPVHTAAIFTIAVEMGIL